MQPTITLSYNGISRVTMSLELSETFIWETYLRGFLTYKEIQTVGGHIKLWQRFPSTSYGPCTTAVREEEEDKKWKMSRLLSVEAYVCWKVRLVLHCSAWVAFFAGFSPKQ